jgi:hypothetical protein
VTTTAAVIGVLAAGIGYGTDVFCALVLRPAAARATDASVADLLGRVHHHGDRRLPVPGVIAILAAAATATTGGGTTRIAAAAALVALLAWLAIYARVSAPINRRLRAAASERTVPPDTRRLQDRWDAVIWPRAALQTLALAGLLTAALTSAT